MPRAVPMFALLVAAAAAPGADVPKPPAGLPVFRAQEIDAGLKIGYAVVVADIDGDTKPDIVVVDQHKVVWYQNPTWKKRVILDGKTKPDNVCVCALDIDGDKLPELVVGAGWKPSDTANPGTLQWLKRGASLDDEWAVRAIPCDEPTVHRVRAFDTDGDGKPELVVAPLMGRGATKAGNWVDGRPVRILAYQVPAKDPETPGNWKPAAVSEDLHVVHNFAESAAPGGGFTAASYGGLHRISRGAGGKWAGAQVGAGDQSNPRGSRGASEVAVGDRGGIAATVEPWHGNTVVVYRPGAGAELWTRAVVDAQLRWGHAVKFTDLGGRGADDLVVGVRDDPDPKQGDTFTERRGVRVYRYDPGTKTWVRHVVESGGVAVEDLAVADLDGDGRPDIVAVGRATGNCRIYWNRGVPK